MRNEKSFQGQGACLSKPVKVCLDLCQKSDLQNFLCMKRKSFQGQAACLTKHPVSLFGFMSGKEGSVENLQNLNLVTGALGGQGIGRVYREETAM